MIKVYNTWKGIKWAPAKVLLPAYPYSLSARERAAREATFLLSELPTPELVAFGKNYVVREYLEGEVVGPDARAVASALKLAHSSCWALGDAKFDNFLVREGKVYFIDGEQAVRTCDPLKQGVDLVEASLFLMLFRGCKEVEALLREYGGGGQLKAFLLPSSLLLLLPCVPRILSVLKELSPPCRRASKPSLLSCWRSISRRARTSSPSS